MSRPVIIDTGEVSSLQKKIDANNLLIKELKEKIDELILKLTYDKNLTFVPSQRIHNEIKNERQRIRYFELQNNTLKSKIERYESNGQND